MAEKKSPVGTREKRGSRLKAFDFSEVGKIKERHRKAKKRKDRMIKAREKSDRDSLYEELKREQGRK